MVVVLSDGVASRGPFPGTDITRRREFLAALEVLGITQNAFANYPDQQFDTVPLLKIVQDIEDAIAKFQPSIVYTHWWGDLNTDHRITCEAVKVACRPVPGCPVKRLLHFEVPSPGASGFEPNWFVDAGETMARKLGALECYGSELRQFPHPRSLLGVGYLAKVRGQSVGLNAAEAFMIGKNVE